MTGDWGSGPCYSEIAPEETYKASPLHQRLERLLSEYHEILQMTQSGQIICSVMGACQLPISWLNR